MSPVKRLVLDVLKPHQPNALDFAETIAALSDDYRVDLKVIEVDESTETLQLSIEADHVDFEAIKAVISENGGSVHSIDEVSAAGK